MSDSTDNWPGRFMQELRRGQERAAELKHERQLAEIRTQSHALKWTGTPDELSATVTRWYEAGWIEAASLQDAMRKASLHFLRPDGMPVFTSLTPAPQSQTGEPNASNGRQAFVNRLLDKKGWSPFEWANEANVDHATALDYLRGKTKPYPSTRAKLAKALGISTELLPK